MEEMDEKIKTTLYWMKRRGFDARYAKDKTAATKLIIDMITPDWVVGCGDSATVRSLGVIQELADRGHRILNPFFKPKILREKPQPTPLHVLKQTIAGCDAYLTGTNAVTMDGKIVNMDGGAMRVAGLIFGPLLRIVVVGRNKIVKDADEAVYRIKNVIAPAHSKNVSQVHHPCWEGKCIEPEVFCEAGIARGCNVLVILEALPNMRDTKIAVILVDEDLGLGWDPAWPQERKDKIYAEYKVNTPPHRPLKKV